MLQQIQELGEGGPLGGCTFPMLGCLALHTGPLPLNHFFRLIPEKKEP